MIDIIKFRNLELLTICEKPVWYGTFIEWTNNKSNENIIKGDIVLNLPDQFGFKSNNKTTTAWVLNLPVVEKVSDIFRFLDYNNRIIESNDKYELVKRDYDISISAKEILNLIYKYKGY